MPRKRMIDPSFWRDEKMGQCAYMERLLFIGLWTFAEDTGVGRANPLLIKADVFPYDTLREADIEKSLAKLASLSLILLYESDTQKYYKVVNFKKHQTINKPTPATLPEPLPYDYGSTTVGLPTEEKIREEKISISKDKEKSAPLSDFEKAVSDFKDFRKSIRTPMTDRAVELLLIDLQKLAPDDEPRKIEILNQSILKGWKGVFEIKEEKKKYATAANLPKKKAPTRTEADQLKRFMESME